MCHKLCSFTHKILDCDCVFVSHLHAVCVKEMECVCQTLRRLRVCVSVCVRTAHHIHLASVAAERGIPIIIIKPTLFSLFEVRRPPFPLATTFQPAHPIVTHTYTHKVTNSLVCSSASRGDCQSYYMECCLPCYIFTL